MSTPLLQVGKRSGRSLAATSTGQQPSRLFYVTDRNSSFRFLVDTSEEASVVPPSAAERKHRQERSNLQAVNGTPIATYGSRSITLNLGLRRTFRWVFIIADTPFPILGADFLRHYSLLVDMRHNRLFDTLTQLKVQGIVSKDVSPSPTFLHTIPKNEYEAILADVI